MPKPDEPISQEELMVNELKSLARKLSNLDEDVHILNRDMASDRKDFEEFKVLLLTISKKQDSILDLITRLQTKTADAVSTAMAEASAPIQEQMDQFVEKKVIRVKVPSDNWTAKVLALIQRWRRR